VASVVLTLGAGGISGCGGTAATFPYERDTVWRAVVGEAIVWRPNLIDDQNYRIESTKADLVSERRYELSVRNDPNLFARRPSTQVRVRMDQTKPTRIHFSGLERDFLLGLKAKLEAVNPPPPR
jgi:hypothetical protein